MNFMNFIIPRGVNVTAVRFHEIDKIYHFMGRGVEEVQRFRQSYGFPPFHGAGGSGPPIL